MALLYHHVRVRATAASRRQRLAHYCPASKNRVNIVILDACRNNPFERRMRGASRGLAAVDAARGTLVAYATAPGSVAADGDGQNGLYTEELLEALREPGLKIEEVFSAYGSTSHAGRRAPRRRGNPRRSPGTSSST
jgi:uncharacterized caspase-like protein